jgi:transcriptional regulator with XRE-family HTH domain
MAEKAQNSLVLYRRRMHFSQKYVAGLLGFPDTTMLSRYELGRSLPPLAKALSLEIIYRVPLAFLFGGMYASLREEIRSKEAKRAHPQPELPLP